MWISIPGEILSVSDRAFSSAPKTTKKARGRLSKNDLQFSAAGRNGVMDRRDSCGLDVQQTAKNLTENWGQTPRRCELAEWKEVMAEQDVRENQITKTSVQELRLILLKDAGDIFAYHDECPHEQH